LESHLKRERAIFANRALRSLGGGKMSYGRVERKLPCDRRALRSNRDGWELTTTVNAPSGRYGPTAVSTGSEMIVWGGSDTVGYTATGARYNATNDVWISTSMMGAPMGRYGHTAVWTGHEMIVWGGTNTYLLSTGARYNQRVTRGHRQLLRTA